MLTTDFIVPQWPAPATVRALVTTRSGGVSQPPWQSLNLGDHVGDEALAVQENRRRLTGFLPAEPVWLNQVHGIRCIDAAQSPRGSAADAALARRPGTVCAVMTADCLPILLCDERGSIVAAAHAGWRGLAAGVIESTLAAMAVAPDSVLAWIGPAIGPRAFAVGEEVRAVFLAQDAGAAAAFVAHGPGKYLCDLPGLAEQRLQKQGVCRITTTDFCTVSDAGRFFSYRRDGVTGRMASCIWLAADAPTQA